MKRVKFLVKGRRGVANKPTMPIIEFDVDDVLELDDETASRVVAAGQGEIVGEAEGKPAKTTKKKTSKKGKLLSTDSVW